MDLSIVIPTYEQLGYGHIVLEQLLGTIQRQRTTLRYEVLVSDDSRDDRIERLCAQHPIRYVRNRRRPGVGGNFNNCLDLAQGAVIKPMCQDDAFLDDDALELFGKTQTWSVSHWSRIWWNRRPIRTDIAPTISRHFRRQNKLGMPSVIAFRRNHLRFDERLRSLVDSWFYHELLREYGEPHVIERPLVGQRYWFGSLTRNQPDYAEEDFALLKKEHRI